MVAAAFFDLDRTLIAGASHFPFRRRSMAGRVDQQPGNRPVRGRGDRLQAFGDKGDKSEGRRAALLGRRRGSVGGGTR